MLDSLGWNGDLERSRDRCDMVIRASSLTERCLIPKLAMIGSFEWVRLEILILKSRVDELTNRVIVERYRRKIQ